MWDIIGVIFGSTGFGTIIGLLGSAYTRWDERKKQELEFEQNFKLATLKMEELKLEQAHELSVVDKQIDKAEAESEIATTKGELSAFRDSIEFGNQKSGVSWVDGFNSLMRPLITVYLLLLATWFSVEIWSAVGGVSSLHKITLVALYKQIIMTFLFLTSTGVTWWFGTRPTHSKKGK